jgi:amiloride-sensitive sodium channel
LLAKYVFNSTKLLLVPSKCQLDVAIVCRSVQNPDYYSNSSDSNPDTKSTLDFLLDPKYNAFKKQAVALKEKNIKKQYKKLNQTMAFEAIFSNMWYSSLPCFDVKGITAESDGEKSILKYCEWKGIEIPCSAIFTKFPTDQGMCCSFNIKAADDIFNGETYPKLVTKLQEADKNLSFGTTKGLKQTLSDQDLEVIPGRNKGLVLMLDAHTDLLSPGSVDSDYEGFLGLISPKDSFPFIMQEGFEIRPGHNNIIALSGSKIEANEDLRKLDKTERQCLFSDENSDLKIHKNYSYINCIFECNLLTANLQMQTMSKIHQGCIPWFFPSEEESITICDPWETVEFFKFMANTSDDSCNYCLPDCSNTIYESSITAVPFRRCDSTNLGMSKLCNLDNINLAQPTKFGKQVREEYKGTQNTTPSFINRFESSERNYPDDNAFTKMPRTYDAYDKDIAMVQIYFKKSTIFQIGSQPKTTWLDFIANVGGLLGLALGMGFVSFIEIIWLGLRLVFRKLNLTNWIV